VSAKENGTKFYTKMLKGRERLDIIGCKKNEFSDIVENLKFDLVTS
jgi:hypothetical protein